VIFTQFFAPSISKYKPKTASDAQIKNACVLHMMTAQLGQSNQRKARLL